jgi:glutamyl-Q tRNA(Asp) synthetase
VAALGSYADARASGGAWLVRMEDLDRPREVRGAADDILRTLDAFGFEWDGPVLYQSTRSDAYADALERLRILGLTFPCACSRREVARDGFPGPEGPVYRGTCRVAVRPDRPARAVRLRTDTPPIAFDDRVQGPFVQDLERDVGDFVLRRADGIHAYQLAVVVDDAAQGVDQVVRGADLLLSTPRQILLHRLLGLPVPAYAHLPLVLDGEGRKLSKSDTAAPVDPRAPLAALGQAWDHLGQSPFDERPLRLSEFWDQALTRWDAERIPARRTGRIPPPRL